MADEGTCSEGEGGMKLEKEQDARLVKKLEQEAVTCFHDLQEEYLASIAISLKRIADYLTLMVNRELPRGP
jgi:hypothetical protein